MSLGALILGGFGALAVIYYIRDRNKVLVALQEGKDKVEMAERSIADIAVSIRHMGSFGDIKPQQAGEALGAAMLHFFSDSYTTDPDGNVVHLPPDEAAYQFFQGLTVTAMQVGMPMIMEELPVLLAGSTSKKVAEAMAEKSAIARGIKKLPDGLAGLQSLQKAMGMVTSSKGGPMELLGKVQMLIGAYQELEKGGIIDLIKNNMGGNGSSENPYPSLPSQKGGGGFTGF